MGFDVLALAVLFTVWASCGFVVWLAFSVATRGHAGLSNLPLAIFTAVVVGPLVPILGLDDLTGFWVSLASALIAPAALIAARRFAAPARSRRKETEQRERALSEPVIAEPAPRKR